MMRKVIALVIKELQSILKDKKSRHVLFLPPIIQLLIFSYAATLDVKNVSLAICNNDSGYQSIELEQRFVGSTIFSHIEHYSSLQEAENALLNRKVSLIMHFDGQFSKQLLSTNTAQVQFLLDGRKSNTTQIVLGYAQRIIDQYNLDLQKKFQGIQSPSIIISRSWFNPNLIYQWFTVPGLVAILGMITSLTATSLTVAKEKEIGTFDQLLVSPLSPWEP